VSEHDFRRSEFGDSGGDSTRSDASTVFSRPTFLEHFSISPRCCVDLDRLYVSISKLCPNLNFIDFEDELFPYFLIINSSVAEKLRISSKRGMQSFRV
jgi:hypothetical protein